LAAGQYSVAIGGEGNTVQAPYGLGAGRRAKALHGGCFVWGDSTDADITSTGVDQFLVRAGGGVHLSASTSQYFDGDYRQVLTLGQDRDFPDSRFGIGVQTGTLYFRTAQFVPAPLPALGPIRGGFAWYAGGTHDDASQSPGPSGLKMMTLGPSGLSVSPDRLFMPVLTLDDAGFRVTLPNALEMRYDMNGDLWVSRDFVRLSDRAAKENFSAVTPLQILDKVVALPISEWNFKGAGAQRHIGPMAQDFRAAFGLGPDDKHIATVDAEGVALAAIQGLNQKVEALQDELHRREAENVALKQRLERLETLLLPQRP
jgi:hypothetical protein